MSEELRPCPFCGAEAEIVRNSSGSYFARCTNRQCAAKTRLYHENENGARLAWNRRAERTCRMEAFLFGEFFTGRKHVTDTELSDEEIDKVLLELRDDTVIRCSACHFSVLDGADVTYAQTDDGAWSVDAVRSRINYCPHCGARVEVDK